VKEDKEKLDEAALEREFKTFIAKLKKQFGDNLAYQVSNYPEGLELSVRVGKKSGASRFTSSFSQSGPVNKQKDKKERRELTEEEKQKRAEKKAKWEAKRKENWEKRQLEREQKENKAPGEQGDSVKEEGKEAANGHTEDNLNEKVAA